MQGAGKVLGFGGEGSRAASALGDHLAKRVSKAASEPAERGSPWAVPSLKFINLINILIFFILKKDRILYLYINYKALNKIIIKNYYLLLLINIKYLIKLNLKDIYYYL